MSWEELYPIVSDQAYYAVLRYDPRRKDKIQELVCQSYEKYLHDVASGKEIKKQNYKCFVTQRAKEVDTRSFCKKGYGGNSSIDVLSFYRRRPDVDTEIIEFDEWMTLKQRNKEEVEEAIAFQIDYNNWQEKLSRIEKKVLNFLIQGFDARTIADKIHCSYTRIKNIVTDLKKAFLRYFCSEELLST